MCDIESALANTVQFIYLHTNLFATCLIHTCWLAIKIAQIIYAQRLFVLVLLALGQH